MTKKLIPITSKSTMKAKIIIDGKECEIVLTEDQNKEHEHFWLIQRNGYSKGNDRCPTLYYCAKCLETITD